MKDRKERYEGIKEVNELKHALNKAEKDLNEQRQILDVMATECLSRNESLSDEDTVLKQNNIVDEILVDIHTLKELIKKAENNEVG